MSAYSRPGLDELRALLADNRAVLWTPVALEGGEYQALVKDSQGNPVAQFVEMETARLYVTLLGHMGLLIERVADLEAIANHLRSQIEASGKKLN